MKILILVIYSNLLVYNEMLKLQRSYLHNHPNIDVYFVAFKDQLDDIVVDKDILWFKGKESLPNILLKTFNGVKYAMNHASYDYLVRTNISTLIHLKNLYSFLESSPRNLFYTGKLMTCKRTLFMQGTAIILSMDVVKQLLAKPIIYDIVDDVKIGLLIKNRFPTIYDNLSNVKLPKFTHNQIDNNSVFIRNKHPKNRHLDIANMKKTITLYLDKVNYPEIGVSVVQRVMVRDCVKGDVLGEEIVDTRIVEVHLE